jgi:calcium-dependent protein kinase
VGTPHYIAPEIFGSNYDEKCDVWSLGVIAYQLFSQGKFPFEGENEIQIFKAIRKSKIYLPEESRAAAEDGPYDWRTMSDEAKDFVS